MKKTIVNGVVILQLAALLVVSHGQPEIFPTPTINGEVDDTVSLACRSQIVAESNSLQIYRPGQDIFVAFRPTAEATDRLVRTDEPDPGVFSNYTFGPLRSTDSGIILRCSSGGETSANLTIVVTFAPIITSPAGDNFEMGEGETLSVSLDVTANPAPTNSVWRRGNTVLTSGGRITVSDNSIAINSLMSQDAGIYTLSVTNEVDTNSFSFNLNVTSPPSYGSELTVGFNCSESATCASNTGVSGMMLCPPRGFPMPALSITTEGVDSTANVDFTPEGEISITNVVAGNAGTYICNATSRDGFPPAIRKFRFFVGGPPDPISMVTPNMNEVNVTFRWMYDDSANGVPADNFTLSIALNTTGDIVRTDSIPVASSPNDVSYNVSLESLRGEENRVYKVSVRVESVQGYSEPVENFFPVNVNGGISTMFSGPSLLGLLLVTIAMLSY